MQQHLCLLESVFIGVYGIVVLDNGPVESGVTQLHEMHSHESNWLSPVVIGSSSNTT